MTVSRIAAAAILMLLAACAKTGGNQTVHAADYLVRGNGAEIKSLDPHYIDGQWEANVVGDMLVGLTTDAADGEPMAGAATRWETSPDGKTCCIFFSLHLFVQKCPNCA